jgi:hypothetical protein
MSDAEQLRHEAARALRLSQLIGDKQASEALAKRAADLLERAEALERENMGQVPQPPATPQQPAQQQQQVQPKKPDDLTDCCRNVDLCIHRESFLRGEPIPWRGRCSSSPAAAMIQAPVAERSKRSRLFAEEALSCNISYPCPLFVRRCVPIVGRQCGSQHRS